jgi:hypothetical protein
MTRGHSTNVLGNCLASSQETTSASATPESCPRGEKQPSLPASIQDEITPEEPDEEVAKSHKGSCSDALANHLQRSVFYQVKKWKDDQWSETEFATSTCTHHTQKKKERLSLLAF